MPRRPIRYQIVLQALVTALRWACGVAVGPRRFGGAGVAVDQKTLADRLRRARIAGGLTQEDVAGALGLPRSAVAQIEAGRRSVSSLELSVLANLHGRDMREFLVGEFDAESSLVAMFRSNGDTAVDEATLQALRRHAGLARDLTRLEDVLGIERPAGVGHRPEALPRSKQTAVAQGQRAADQERLRLGLGSSPIRDLVDLCENEGVRVSEIPLPDEISGVCLVAGDVGALVVINAGHAEVRRRFSLAHEYCHVLLDRARKPAVSSTAFSADLVETRANAFAASLLMPYDGIVRYLQSLGKAPAPRTDVDDSAMERGSVRTRGVERRAIELSDVVRLAAWFGVSRVAMLHRLRNLAIIDRRGYDALSRRNDAHGAGLAKTLGVGSEATSAPEHLHARLVNLALDAYAAEEISKAKLDELCVAALGRTLDVIEAVGEED